MTRFEVMTEDELMALPPMKRLPVVRALPSDFLQWLWYSHKQNHVARYICNLPITHETDRDAIADEVLKLAFPGYTWKEAYYQNLRLEYDDRMISAKRLDNGVHSWYLDYFCIRCPSDRWGNFTDGEPKNISTHVRFDILKRDNYRCGICGAGAPRQLEIDHIRSRAKGGSNFLWNLWTLCRECNNGKSDKEL